MEKFEVGKYYWCSLPGFGFDRIEKVKLLVPIMKDDKLIGFESKIVNNKYNCSISIEHLFHTKEEAENYREKLAAIQIEETRKKTDTPEKMLDYLMNLCRSEYDGYCDIKDREDLRARAQELFGVKLK